MARLITGGSGFIGAALAQRLVDRGFEVVVLDIADSHRLDKIRNQIKFLKGDQGIWSEVMNAVKDYGITHIYHLGALLTSDSEANPWRSFQTNTIGIFNVLEAARLFGVERVVFTSSIGTFDSGTVPELTDTTLQRPATMYGAAKLYGEGLGRFYHRKFGLDFRALRYPSVMGPGATAAGHWEVPMIEAILAGKEFACHAPPDAVQPMLYVSDAARAAEELMDAPAEKIRMTTYNIAGTPIITARELEQSLRKLRPDAKITYPKTEEKARRFRIKTWDDRYAREEWGWRPRIATLDEVLAAFVHDMADR